MPAQNHKQHPYHSNNKNNNNKRNYSKNEVDWTRKKSALSIEKFAKDDVQYKRKLQKIENVKKEKELLGYRRKRLMRKGGFLNKDDDDKPLPEFLTVCVC